MQEIVSSIKKLNFLYDAESITQCTWSFTPTHTFSLFNTQCHILCLFLLDGGPYCVWRCSDYELSRGPEGEKKQLSKNAYYSNQQHSDFITSMWKRFEGPRVTVESYSYGPFNVRG